MPSPKDLLKLFQVIEEASAASKAAASAAKSEKLMEAAGKLPKGTEAGRAALEEELARSQAVKDAYYNKQFPQTETGRNALAQAKKTLAPKQKVEAPAVIIPSKISNVQKIVREKKGEYGAKRVQRAADQIKNLEDQFTEDALRGAFTGDNATALMIGNPADFKYFAAEMRSPHQPALEEYLQRMSPGGGGARDVPFLELNQNEGRLPFVSGHEGRHRNIAMEQLQYPSTLWRMLPRAALREDFPRRSQDEYLEALIKHLGTDEPLVIPEGQSWGAAMNLPKLFAEGGEVHMKDGGGKTRAGTPAQLFPWEEQYERTKQRLQGLVTDPEQELKNIVDQYLPTRGDSPEERERKLDDLAMGFAGTTSPRIGKVGGVKVKSTVHEPERMAFPGIYQRPDVIAAEAASRVATESPNLQKVFGVTRDDLYQMGKNRQGNLPGTLPGAAAKPKGSKAAAKVMTKKNEQRLIDTMAEAEKHPELVRGMDPWYIMDPVYQRMEQLLGRDKAIEEYRKLNTLMGMASPGSEVLTEIPRGTAAYYLQNQGRFSDFMKYAGQPAGSRGADFPADILNVPGHAYHKTAQATPMQQFLESGEMQMSSPKVPMYIEASGSPLSGFQTRTPVGDAHWSRAVGLADTRGAATRKGQPVIPGASVTNPEMVLLAPWWRESIAAPMNLESVPAQARAWGTFSGQTGVTTPIGAPKLELLADKIAETAHRLGVSLDKARDLVLTGETYAGKAEGGDISKDDAPEVDLERLLNEHVNAFKDPATGVSGLIAGKSFSPLEGVDMRGMASLIRGAEPKDIKNLALTIELAKRMGIKLDEKGLSQVYGKLTDDGGLRLGYSPKDKSAHLSYWAPFAEGGGVHMAEGSTPEKARARTRAGTLPTEGNMITGAIQGLGDMISQAGRGSLSALLGAPADIINMADIPQIMTGQSYQIPYGSEYFKENLPFKPTTQTGKVSQELGSFVPLPLSNAGKAVKTVGSALAPTAQDMLQMSLEKLSEPTRSYVIKPEGGNWIQSGRGSAENYLKPFTGESIIDPYNILPKEEKALAEANESAITNFAGKKLNRYIKNEMGTKSDPVRLQADAWPDTQARLLADKQKQIDKVQSDIAKAQQDRNVGPDVLTRSQARLRQLQKEYALIENRKGLHIQNPRQLTESLLRNKRGRYGMPQTNLGVSQAARDWENLSDTAIIGAPYREQLPLLDQPSTNPIIQRIQNGYSVTEAEMAEAINPELEKLGGEFAVKNPDAIAYSINRAIPTNELGFDHLIDELGNALSPHQGLPENLRLTAKTLDKMSVPQAIEHVDKINAWRASQKAEADAARAANIATVEHKTYNTVPGTDIPNEAGLKWVEIKMPENAEFPEGYSIQSANGTPYLADEKGRVVSYVNDEGQARKIIGKQAVEDALKYEGEMLAHCVGGYCPDVLSGKSRIFSLRDNAGRPHATIEVEPDARVGFRLGEGPQGDEFYAQQNKYIAGQNKGFIPNNITFAEWWRSENGIPEPKRGERISQIKGLQNRKPQDEYMPYVQDFVKSGDWSHIGDLHHTDLFKVTQGQKLPGFSKEIPPGYYTLDEFKKMAAENEMPQEILDNWMDKLGGRRFFGMKEGGAVDYESKFNQMLQDHIAGMAEGGAVDYESRFNDMLQKHVQGMAEGGEVENSYNNDPDMADGGRFIQAPAFADGGAVKSIWTVN